MEDVRLITAIEENNLESVKQILVQSPSLVSKEALFCAAKEGNLGILKYLVEYSRINLNEYDDDHRNVLHYGTESGDLEVFRYLVEKCGMDPLCGDVNLVTPWDLLHGLIEEYKEMFADISDDEKVTHIVR